MKKEIKKFDTEARRDAFLAGFLLGRDEAVTIEPVGTHEIEIADSSDPTVANMAELLAFFGEEDPRCLDLHLPAHWDYWLLLPGEGGYGLLELVDAGPAEILRAVGIRVAAKGSEPLRDLVFPIADWYEETMKLNEETKDG